MKKRMLTSLLCIGMVLAVDPADTDKVLEAVKKAGETGYVIGTVEDGEKGVTLC